MKIVGNILAFLMLVTFASTSLFAEGNSGGVTWTTNYQEALAQSKQNSQPIVLFFTGSDWCGWCKKLDAETFSKPEFETYAKKNLVLVTVDFPAQKPQSDELKAANKALGTKYSVNGYPTIVVIAPDGTIVWQQVGYLEGGPSAFIAALEKAKLSGAKS